MSMQSVLGVVGGVVGSFFGYPQLGFVVGSLVGGLLTPKEKTEGPRLDDLKVQVSTYGSGIPILYGTERIGGNVVWSTNKIETSTTEEVGKGGGAEHTSYKYFVHMRIALCETPRDGSEVAIVQIFQDGKLKWDARSGIPVASALASDENLFAFFTLYQGHSDQLPDPVEEIYTAGPGSVPAYRGVVSISMKAIECPGGRVPQFSFVLSTSTTVENTVQAFTVVPSVELDNQALYAVIRQTEIWHVEVTGDWFGSDFTAHVYRCGVGYATHERNIHLPTSSLVASIIPLSGNGNPAVLYPYNGSLARIDLDTGVSSFAYSYDGQVPSTWHGHASNRSAGYDEATGTYVIHAGDGSEPSNIWLIRDGIIRLGDPVSGVCGAVTVLDQYAYALSQDSGHLILSRYSSDDGVIVDSSTGPAYADGSDSIKFSALHPTSEGIYVWARDVPNVGGVLNKLWLVTFPGVSAVWTLLNDAVQTDPAEKVTATPTTMYAGREYAIIGPDNDATHQGFHTYSLCRHVAVITDEVKVSDIIADQCQRSVETRFDVSGIPDADTIHGYKIQNPASARNNVEPLLTAFAIYAVDEDGLIKFKKYEDIASESTISYDELGQAEEGSEPADAMPLNRTQEIDLPKSVSVSYVEETFDYQTATEKEERQVTEANEDLTIELPIATDSDHAKKVAQMILFARWRAQNTRSLKVSRKYAFLSPGDGITVEYPRGTSRLWRIMSFTDTGALIELSVEPGDASIYTQTAIGATGYVRQEVSAISPPTRMVLLDSPIFRDEDNNAGIYVAAEGYASGWRGYTLWVGDDDTNLQDRGTKTSSVPIGLAESALGGWAYNMLDGMNSVILDMGSDTLASTTEALLMTSRVNLAVIGAHGRWEVIQFMTASSLGSGRYLIYGLLRGLFGTERFAGTHQVGDQFVLISADGSVPSGMLRPNMDVGSVGQTKSYRGVSIGSSLESVTSQRLANEGVGLLPYSPWDPRKSKAASNDQTITWQRRSRLSTNALRGVVPLGEATEAYQIDFYTSSSFATLAGTLTTTTKSVTITSAQQTAFGLTPGSTLYVHISQVSDSVGSGAPLEATL